MADEDVTRSLLARPPKETCEEYFSEIVGRFAKGTVRVTEDVGGGKGRGVEAARRLAEGEVVFEEAPVAAIQHFSNASHALVCAACFRFLGTVELQAGRLLLAQRMRVLEEQGTDEARAELARIAKLLGPLAQFVPTGAEEDDLQPSEDGSEGGEDEGQSQHKQPSVDELVALFLGTRSLSGSSSINAHLPRVWVCPGGCAHRAYCSSECMASDWRHSHQLLCPGLPETVRSRGPPARPVALTGDSHPPWLQGDWEAYPIHDVRRSVPAARSLLDLVGEANDTLYLAAVVATNTAARASEAMGSDPGPGGSAAGTARRSADQWRSALPAAFLPYAVGHKRAWWDQVTPPSDVEDEGDFHGSLRDMVQDLSSMMRCGKRIVGACCRCMWQLGASHAWHADMRSVVLPACRALLLPRHGDGVAPLCEGEFLGNLMGMFELNNLTVFVPGVLGQWVQSATSEGRSGVPEEAGVAGERATSADQAGLGPGSAQADAELGSAVAAALARLRPGTGDCQGSGFFALYSCLNHSCEPNATADKLWGVPADQAWDQGSAGAPGAWRDGRAVVRALRDIAESQEVLVSYVDADEPPEDRARAFLDYGFECRCPRCRAGL